MIDRIDRLSQSTSLPCILVVDDNEQHRNLVRDVLGRDDYTVIACSGGQEALRVLAEEDFDLVLIDFIMPGVSGADVLRHMKESSRLSRVPVLMISAIQDPDEQVRILDLGADDFITKPFEPKVLRARVRSLVRLKRFHDETEYFEDVLSTLNIAVEAKDLYTQGHSRNVSRIARQLGKELGQDEETVNLLEIGGLLHDIGKLVVDLSFINKPGKLTEQEWAIMKTHPEAGARICAPLRSARPLIPLIRHHHEKLDGTGYPDGLVEDQITYPVRIISVVDVYDALTTDRSYRRGMTHEKAIGILRQESAAGSWDEEIVECMDEIGSRSNQ